MDFCGLFATSRNPIHERVNGMTRLLAMAIFLLFSFMILGGPAVAQSPGFTDFSSQTNLTTVGDAAFVPEGTPTTLRLTPAATQRVGGAWFNIKQPVAGGFTTVFTFQITNSNEAQNFPADGIAFVIQNAPPSELPPFSGTSTLAGAGGALGYAAGLAFPTSANQLTPGIPNSLAVEFDTFTNPWDPNNNHVAVQSCGTGENNEFHSVGESFEPCNLALNSDLPATLADGEVHTVTIDYLPPVNCVECSGILRVNLDGTDLFPNGVAVDLATLLSLDNGTAWAGFTGATGDLIENNDILSWTFTPHTSTTITQTVNPGVTSVFTFGEYNYKITPDTITNIGGDILTVTSFPIDPSQFDPGPNFPGAQCIPYAGNNGNCSEFQVTCSGPDCNTGTYQLALNWDSPSPVPPPPNVTHGLLDAPDQPCPPPAGHPFSKNIFTAFAATRQDPVVKGSGGPRYSCFVAVQNVTYGNADLVALNVPTIKGLPTLKVKPGTNLIYAIGLTNLGPNQANGVVITDQLDPNTSFVSGTVAQTTCTFLLRGLTCTKPVPQACSANGQLVTCPVGVLAATTGPSLTAAAAAVTVTVNPAACSSGTCPSLRNTATASAINPDPKPKSNSSTAVTQVVK
jgi:uncharacterized repeat protein (TIGR01451 family)